MTTLRLGKLLGIELRLDYSWFLIFLLLTWSLAGHYLMVNAGWSAGVRLVLALVTALLFFASVLAHEYGHSLVARRLGVGVERITLFIFGGMAHLKGEPKRARDEFLIAIAGPLVSLGLAAVFALVANYQPRPRPL
jgi:Zn-dependent protease